MTTIDRRRTRALVSLAGAGRAGTWVEALVFTGWLVWLNDLPSHSTWESVGGFFGRGFFAFPLGWAMIRRHLPLFVAHGQTRRAFMALAALVVLVYAGAGALVMAAGLLAEAAVYGAFGWPHRAFWSHLFDAPLQVWLVVAEYGLLFTVWAMAGALVAASRGHRRGLRGALRVTVSLALGAALVVTAEIVVGAPLPTLVGVVTAPPVAVAVAVCAAVAGLGFVATRAAVHPRTVSSGGST